MADRFVLKCGHLYVGCNGGFYDGTGQLFTRKNCVSFSSATDARTFRTAVGFSYATGTKIFRLVPHTKRFKPGQFVSNRGGGVAMVLGAYAHLAIDTIGCTRKSSTPVIYMDGSGEWIDSSELQPATYEDFIR